MFYPKISSNNLNNIEELIKKSYDKYNELFKQKEEANIFKYLVDDTYNFDCLRNTMEWFSDVKLIPNIDFQKNKDLIDKYNKYLKTNKDFQNELLKIKDYYSNDYQANKFIESLINKHINKSDTEQLIKLNIKKITELYTNFIILPPNIIKYLSDNKLPTKINFSNYKSILLRINDVNMYSQINKLVLDTANKYIINLIYLILNRKILAMNNNFENYISYIFDKSYDSFNIIKNDNFIPSLSDLINFVVQTINLKDTTIFDIISSYISNQTKQIDYELLYNMVIRYVSKCSTITFKPLKTFNNTLLLICSFLGLTLKETKTQLTQSYYIYQGNNAIGEINCLIKENNQTNIKLYRFNNRLYNSQYNKFSIVVSNVLIEYNKNITFEDFIDILNICIELIFYTLQKTKYGNLTNKYFNYFSTIIKTFIYTQDNLQTINNELTQSQLKLINIYLNLQYEFLFKNKCLYILFYIFTYSNDKFIKDCKKLIEENNNLSDIDTTQCMKEIPKNDTSNKITSFIKSIYNELFSTIMSYPTLKINHNINDFHPLSWINYILDNEDSINAVNNLLSELYGIQFVMEYKNIKNEDVKKSKMQNLINCLESPNYFEFKDELKLRYFDLYINEITNWDLDIQSTDSTINMMNELLEQ